ncbi:glycosyltransferase [Rubrivivax rivuli]|uniref:glycosyltransferase n=1 Tax=Rubrivivax rivuli TaxID=1862385 RepID=UPI0013E38048|nr:glycosyltransferase [Rubrivivax rivuli]
MSSRRPRLAFVSPVFLFPNDAGGKIRSTNILRGLKGGSFEIVLLSPATGEQQDRWQAELKGVCDEFIAWQPTPPRPQWARALQLLSELPVNVVADRTAAGLAAVRALAARQDIDLIVFDFVHAAVLQPASARAPAVCFTHNVEAEIFARHAQQAPNALRRWLWRSQHRKMLRFEGEALRRFARVIAVSERDAQAFRSQYGVQQAEAIPTGVDLDFFAWQAPPPVDAAHPPTVVFTGSMDWRANIDGVQFFLGEVWPLVLAAMPEARFVVVGKNPPAALQAAARLSKNVEFTGFVDDVRPYAHAAHAFVIPLLVGGGTRIKAFEAMAMGCPVVSTTIGMEGLEAEPGRHFVQCDQAAAMASALLALLADGAQRERLSRAARALVEARFGHRQVAQVFEGICQRALAQAAPRATAAA